MHSFDWVDANSSEQAVRLLGKTRDKAKVLAGGTDLLDELKEGIVAPERLINIKSNKALRYIRFAPATGLHLGALTTLAELEEHSTLREHYPILFQAVGQIASPQIRNVATVGGNLCQRPRCCYYRNDAFHCKRKAGPVCFSVNGENMYHAILGGHQCYIVHPSDLAPPLIALGASLTLFGPAGRRTIPLEKFFIGPKANILRENILGQNEIVEEVWVPAPSRTTGGAFVKVRERNAWDFSLVSASAVLNMAGGNCRDARIVLGAVAPIPWRSPKAEKVLRGAKIDAAVAERAAEAALAEARPMTQNSYKVPLAKALLKRAILRAAGAA